MGMTIPSETGSARSRPELPPPSYGDAEKCDPAKLRAWQDDRILYTHPYRVRRHRIWRKADLFDQSIQWLVDSFNADPTRTMHWAALTFHPNDPDAIPTPVYNEFSGPVDNEAARLGRPEYKPYVRPSGENPDIKTRTGAKTGEKVIAHELDAMRWNEQSDMGELHMPLYGQWYLKSYWDTTWEETVRVPVLSAKKCPACDFKLSSPTMDDPLSVGKAAEMSLQKPGLLQREDYEAPGPDGFNVEKVKYTTDSCLTCDTHEGMVEQDVPATDEWDEPLLDDLGLPVMGKAMLPGNIPGPPELESYTPVDEELQSKDYFGRDLGQDVQLGRWRLKTVDPYSLFIENLGVGISSIQDAKEITEVHVESLEWLCNRYENGHLVKPENAQALMEYHPVAGERAIFYGDGLFRSNARVKETHKKPWREKGPDGKYRTNRGRTLIMAGDVVLFDGDYLIESKNNPGEYMPRVHYDMAAWKLRSGGSELSAVSMSEGLFDAQENVNEIKSQTQDARQTEGSPRWLTERHSDLDYVTSASGGSLWIWTADPALQGLDKPERITSTLINPQIYSELEADQEFMLRHGHQNEVESGGPPDGISAALALQFLGEQSGEVRRPRIRRVREMLQRVFKHGLQLMHELVREPREYMDREDNNEWREHTWQGLDLMGQCDVRIDPEPEHDSDLQRQQVTRDAIEAGLIDVTKPRSQRLVADILKVPKEVYEEDNLQEEDAEREYCQFRDEGTDPVLDEDLDHHHTHFQRHGIDCHSETFRELEIAAGWDKALPYLSGWQAKFDPQPGPPMMGSDPATGVPVPMPGPMVPGLDGQLGLEVPPAPEVRIFTAWTLILQQGGYVPAPEEKESLLRVMRFRAHMAAHKRLAAQEAAMSQMGAAVVAAPEAPQMSDGTAPAGTEMPAMVQ